MSLKAILYAYVLGGITFIPLVIFGLLCYTIYTSVPVGDLDPAKFTRATLEQRPVDDDTKGDDSSATVTTSGTPDVNDLPKSKKGWLTVRRTFEETPTEGSYVGFVRGFLDARSKDPKRSRPKDMWYVALKGKVLYLYEDENMTECEAAIELGGHGVVIYPEGLLDGELFAKRNAICLKPKAPASEPEMPSLTKEMQFADDVSEEVRKAAEGATTARQKANVEELQETEEKREEARAEALDRSTPWFIFVRSNVEMEDWYLALIHASDNPPNSSTLTPLEAVFRPADMSHLVSTIDEQPDVIPMRWLNALLGRLFFSFYRTQHLESYIIGRLMRKLGKIKRPSFLTHIVVREVSVGNTAPTFSKPMLKELTKEGDAALEVHLHYKGEVRVTIEAVATINLGARFKSYAVKLVLAVVLRELEGNLLVKVKRPPSNRMWYAFTQMPRMVLDVEPVVSDRQITWSMILSTIESKLKEVIQESVVLPNMDDIAFFESSKHSHRGGIWSDASRQEKASALFPTHTAPAEDDKSTVSEPPLESQTTPASSASTPEPIPPLLRSQSAVETQLDTNPASGPPDNLPMTRPATMNGVLSPSPGRSMSSRRRTWFGGSRNDDPFANDNVEGFDDVDERGRQDRTETTASRRSSSTRSSPSVSGDTTQAPAMDEDNTHLKPVPVQWTSSRRSHSHSFSSQDIAAASSDNLSTSAPGESSMASYRSQSPSQAGPSEIGKTPVSPTFFQTLKSRDKQAISNTAKEAMRKWGVNWGSLRKGNDAGNASAVTEEAPSDGDPERHSESVTVHKPRPSYAEVRAAVEQRKDKEKIHVESPGTDLHASDHDNSSQSGGEPREQSGNETSPEVRDETLLSTYTGGGALSPSISPRHPGVGPDSSPSSRSVSPLQRPRTISRRSNPPEGLPDIDEPPPSIPIHTQPPRPKMMSIPGIHASHRGDVMSMGYAPPPPPPEMRKAPAIQSVYRLWQKPGQQEQQQQFQEAQSQETSSGGDQGVAPAAAPSEPSGSYSSGRPVPPPLPPRSIPTQVQTQAEFPKIPLEQDRIVSPASQALQSIVTKDRSKRASLEPPPKTNPPPLPERRASLTPAADSLRESTRGDGSSSLSPPNQHVADNPSGMNSTGSTAAEAGGASVNAKPPALPPRRIQASA